MTGARVLAWWNGVGASDYWIRHSSHSDFEPSSIFDVIQLFGPRFAALPVLITSFLITGTKILSRTLYAKIHYF